MKIVKRGTSMKSHAFTLVELLVSLSILIVLLWLVPPAIVDFGETYQERVFIKQFENDLKLVQASAQATGKFSKVVINDKKQNTYSLVCFGNEVLNATREIPHSIYIKGTQTIGFKNETGNLTTYNRVQNITFRGKKYTYEYILRFGGGRGYVKVSKN